MLNQSKQHCLLLRLHDGGSESYEGYEELLAALPEGNVILRLKFPRENDNDWVLEDKFDPVRTERKKARGSSRYLGTQSPAC